MPEVKPDHMDADITHTVRALRHETALSLAAHQAARARLLAQAATLAPPKPIAEAEPAPTFLVALSQFLIGNGSQDYQRQRIGSRIPHHFNIDRLCSQQLLAMRV